MNKKKYNKKYSVHYKEEKINKEYFEKIYLCPDENHDDLDRKIRDRIRNPNVTTTFVATEEKMN